MKTRAVVTLMRVIVGILFMAHGISKFQMGLGNTAGWFGSIGIPEFVAYIVAFLELIGGIALVVGFATRYFSAAFVIMLIGAIFTAKLDGGLLGTDGMAGYELDLALIALAAYFTIADERGVGVDQLITTRK
ncbi:Putative oxidoreductase CatD [Paenibacillus plantiphilus]|uniref:Oxidoreductase CatD n=1 Tax=Paenibacillus plantiphilus TaxID=2905650 RepID=A0ABN8GBZ7_9BACL|nr:DoxX family protein [Paenibacillus plantiphilus]CAH1201952.1 Putative oxidoreductase CatD [Paenibacillus plantiphilus]